VEINIKQLGPQELAVLRKEIQSAFDEIKSKYGLSQLSLGNIRFDLLRFGKSSLSSPHANKSVPVNNSISISDQGSLIRALFSKGGFLLLYLQ